MPNPEIALPAIERLRDSEEREAMRERCNLTHRALEEQLVVGDARKQILLASAAYVFEKLPRVLSALVTQAVEGNLPAGKAVLEIAGLEESVRETVAANTRAHEEPSMDVEFLQTLRARIEAMPQNPDPINTP